MLQNRTLITGTPALRRVVAPKGQRTTQSDIDAEYAEKIARAEAKVSGNNTYIVKQRMKEKIMANESEVEQEIQDKGLNAPRLTPELIDETIADEDYHVFEGSQLTVCCLTLQNGFTVIGESACASPENFDAELGRKIAKGKARDKIWPLAGYLLKQRLFENKVENTQGQM